VAQRLQQAVAQAQREAVAEGALQQDQGAVEQEGAVEVDAAAVAVAVAVDVVVVAVEEVVAVDANKTQLVQRVKDLHIIVSSGRDSSWQPSSFAVIFFLSVF